MFGTIPLVETVILLRFGDGNNSRIGDGIEGFLHVAIKVKLFTLTLNLGFCSGKVDDCAAV